MGPRFRGDDGGGSAESLIEGANSIPCDDLAFAVVNVGRVEQVAGAAADQKFRAAGTDRVVAAAPGGRFASLVFRQQRQRKDIAPDLPRGSDLFGIGTDTERN